MVLKLLHQVPPQKIFGFSSTTIMTNIKMQYKWLPTAPGVCSRCVCVCVHGVCVFTAVCVCALWLGLKVQSANSEYVTSLSLSVAPYTVKKLKNESV